MSKKEVPVLGGPYSGVSSSNVVSTRYKVYSLVQL